MEITERLGSSGFPRTMVWAAPEHTFFALEEDIHHGALRCFALRSCRSRSERHSATRATAARSEDASGQPRGRGASGGEARRRRGAEGGTGAPSIRITRPMPGARLVDRAPGTGLAWLAALTQIEQVGRAETVDAASVGRQAALDEHDRRLLATLDRVGLAPGELLAYAALSEEPDRGLTDRVARLHHQGLIARHRSRSSGRPGGPLLYAITPNGCAPPRSTARPRSPSDAIGSRSAAKRPRARPPCAGADVGARAATRRGGQRHRQLAHPPVRERPLPPVARNRRARDHPRRAPPATRAEARGHTGRVRRSETRRVARTAAPRQQADPRVARPSDRRRGGGQGDAPRLRRVSGRLVLADPRLARQSDRPVVVLVCATSKRP